MDSCTKCLREWGTRDVVGEAQSGRMTLVGDAIGVGESSTSIRGMLGKKFECKKTMLIAQTSDSSRVFRMLGAADVERTEAAA